MPPNVRGGPDCFLLVALLYAIAGQHMRDTDMMMPPNGWLTSRASWLRAFSSSTPGSAIIDSGSWFPSVQCVEGTGWVAALGHAGYAGRAAAAA